MKKEENGQKQFFFFFFSPCVLGFKTRVEEEIGYGGTEQTRSSVCSPWPTVFGRAASLEKREARRAIQSADIFDHLCHSTHLFGPAFRQRRVQLEPRRIKKKGDRAYL